MKLCLFLKRFSVVLLGLTAAHSSLAIERVSVSSSGQQSMKEISNSDFRIGSLSGKCSISDNGQFVLFKSPSSNLVDDDTNEEVDFFVHDQIASTTIRVNVASDGSQAIGGIKTAGYVDQTEDVSSRSNGACISGDGRYIAFESSATNLVSGTSLRKLRIYLHDRIEGATNLIVDLPIYGKLQDMTPDGRYIVYSDRGTINTGTDHLFIYDRVTGSTEQIPYPPDLVSEYNPGSGDSLQMRRLTISDDGRYLLYQASIWNVYFVVIPSGYYLYDRVTKTHTEYPGISIVSGNGRYVISLQGSEGIVHDRQNDTRRKLYGINYNFAMTPDGRYVVSRAGFHDVIVHDLNTGKHAWITNPVTGNLHTSSLQFHSGEDQKVQPAISSDGGYIAFMSFYDDLVEGDTNETYDVFVAKNPLIDLQAQPLTVEKLINYNERVSPFLYGWLFKDTQYRAEYRVTNHSSDRLYNVNVYDNGNLVCKMYTLEPGQSKRRCTSLSYSDTSGEFVSEVEVMATVSGSGEERTADTRSYVSISNTVLDYQYGLGVLYQIKDVNGKWVNSYDAASAVQLNSENAEVLFRVTNSRAHALYRVKVYHDAVSPVDDPWIEQCDIGTLFPGQTRYCKRTVTFNGPGLNVANGRARADNSLSGSNYVVKRVDPVYVVVP